VKIDPRQALLDVWTATVRSSTRSGQWEFGGRDGSNSISDAEQLLCVLLPATQVAAFALDRPNSTSESMAQALAGLGDVNRIPMRLARILTTYFSTYVDESGRPSFAGGSYYSGVGGNEPTKEQQSRDIVDSFAISVTLSLATIGFVRIYRTSVTRRSSQDELDALEKLASARLTAAMVGLLRSFASHSFDTSMPYGQILVDTIRQDGQKTRTAVERFRSELQQTIASFGEVLIGSGQIDDLDIDDRLFECGWSWGVVHDAPQIDIEDPDVRAQIGGEQRGGVAENKPYLYFTVVAVDAIEDLFSERTRILGLLNEEQQRLSRALQLRYDLTLTYWATVAMFDNGPEWPLERPPWRTTDDIPNDYHTLLVTSIAVKDLVRKRGSDARLARIGVVLTRLADEARITRRYSPGDKGVRLHVPGLVVALEAQERSEAADPSPMWVVSEFASLLLQRSIVIAGLMNDVEQRAVLLRLADRLWDHLALRRFPSEDAEGHHTGLWDQPARRFPGLERYDEPSWYYTERVVQGLVSTANLLISEPLVNQRVVDRTFDLLYEAEHLYDMELMRGSGDAGGEVLEALLKVRINLDRAREIAPMRPGTAGSLINRVLKDLDGLETARKNGNSGT
jgi:hypothetical protein